MFTLMAKDIISIFGSKMLLKWTYAYSRSKDPVWAMFSVMLVIFVLVWASWCCGLRKIDTKKFIDVTIDESFHYISVRGKRPYSFKHMYFVHILSLVTDNNRS